ncbi:MULTISPECIES: Xaa-Pro peptidase family protein [unclassified Mesorhizobium]|uniref:M24 family metallopeptidase n=1 Tax=unclassified Mesorhizobium TaxID=325217 RepID=UPI000F763AFD|nr:MULTISPECIES: Xaa-Pro peptidase family protein [unclassified Mesorhizobium]TGT63520.1 aminopeptidase P family protein [Mesorhizobium sp. M00.F.Ca.ET.170.01.1.1]AZO11391.1 aminopeptidase P family protein [Mesorhizobium sp. M3A.F.Ca.ET.080.04.2.1]RWB76711.1 MAG: aminopeptidase P family protein [Mesorhizobium sp.]RWB92112.1 MAG: aminopeptidase P family protein [Mesorhizobium sp.]RWE29930.1 MAG: aminopeptidase P family protein [Mesorhizobium sp.]
MNIAADKANVSGIPFDQGRVDRLMDEAGIDVLLATSKHNTQYLLGGYKFIFFAAMDAIGHSRYLPIVLYEKGGPEHAAYIGNKMEGGEHQNHPFWTPTLHAACWGTLDAANLAVEHLHKIGKSAARIGIEPAFLPSDAYALIRKTLPDAKLIDATGMLERMRAIKTEAELEKLRIASELITDSMLATIAWAREGTTKTDIIEQLRREETNRGAHFEYCLLTLGSSHNRAASSQAWQKGDVLSIDSGGNYHGYIGDLCRMGVLGEPDGELEDLLAEVEAVQQAAFSNVKAGTLGGDMITHAESVLKRSKVAAYTDFFAHGMGLITHEAPFLMTNHPVAYEGTYAAKPLEKNMVLSVETTMLHPTRGFIKLEDTVAVTETGYVMFGDRGRGWNRGGI